MTCGSKEDSPYSRIRSRFLSHSRMTYYPEDRGNYIAHAVSLSRAEFNGGGDKATSRGMKKPVHKRMKISREGFRRILRAEL